MAGKKKNQTVVTSSARWQYTIWDITYDEIH